MLNEIYNLLKIMKKEIPFNSLISIFLYEDILVIQTFFEKGKIKYYFNQEFTEESITDNLSKGSLIDIYIKKLNAFYLEAKPEDLEKSDLLNQTIVTNTLKEETK